MNDFFASFYEGIYPWDIFYIQGFSQDMFNSGGYILTGWFWIISSTLLTLFYYYVLSNYGRLFKRSYWFLWILFACAVNFIGAYYFSIGAMDDFFKNADEGSPYGFFEYFSFSMVNVLWTFLLCVVLSIVFKFKSIKASRTPF